MNPRVYFYCLDNPNAYQDDIVVLADGLQQLGVEVFANCHYWQKSPKAADWLIGPDPHVRPQDCDIVAVNGAWSRWIDNNFKVYELPLPEGLFAPGRRYRTAYMDHDDGYATSAWRQEFRAFDTIFRAQYNGRCFQPSNHRPWVLGLNQRMLDMTAGSPAWSDRKPELLVNFGASHPYEHSARAQAGPPFLTTARRYFSINDKRDDLKIPPSDPYDRLMWEQTQHRHSRDYYNRLKAAQAVVAFCGELIPPAPFYPRYLVGGRQAQIKRLGYDLLARFDARPPRLIQWDSWRFWEALAAGCLVFNLDLPHYGVELPVMPRHLVEYVAVRPENTEEVFAQLMGNPGLPERIAIKGRAWALEHYSPKALARRFLNTMLG
jgi:hypothetical protein